MITINLTGQAEKLAPEDLWNLAQTPLYHQYRTAVALQNPSTHLVVNSYNTGTGKTRASFLHLFAINGTQQDVLFVAPTNALLGQHADDAQEFIQQHGLDFQVFTVTAASNRLRSQQLVEQGDYLHMRSGESLYRLVRNYREFLPDAQRRQGLVLVVNPDIFYYALMFQYGSHDQRNLFQSFLTHFNYIIIDEFHYYDQKQLAFFLFFFAISKQMGYFEQAGRKICLLSATPNSHVITYLNRLFGDNWQHISPDNEPAESESLETIPTLTPLTLTISSQNLLEWGQANGRSLFNWINQDQQDGAVISDSLRRINRLQADLLPNLGETNLGRITGPEPEGARQTATGKPLILATPTVDIGYNFQKRNKQRQNIDFLICEARFGDDLIQRIGRAGRILGKTEQDHPSRTVTLLNETVVDALRPYDGQTLTRAQFKEIIQANQDSLPQKHNLTGYIRSWAITEIFYPIYRTQMQLVLEEERLLVEELYEQLRDLFGVRGTSFRSLSAYFRKFYHRQQWLKANKKEIVYNRQTAEQVADWFKFRGEAEYKVVDIEPYLAHESVLAYPQQKAELRRFVASQYYLTQSLFNFRDSFQGPTAVVYDPHNLLSTETTNSYDLFHIVEAYDVHWFENRAEFIQLCGETELQGDFYGRLRRHRDPLLSLELHYQSDEVREQFQRLWEGRPVALSGFRLFAKERGGDIFPIEDRITTSLEKAFLTVLLIAPDMKGWAIRQLKNSPLYGRKLTIDCYDQQGIEYTAYIGKAAWLAFPELQVAFKIRDRMKAEAIII